MTSRSSCLHPKYIARKDALVSNGATVAGNAPKGLATLTDRKKAQKRFDVIVKKLWGEKHEAGMRKVGNGLVT